MQNAPPDTSYAFSRNRMVEDLEKLYLSGLQFLIPLTEEETYVKIVEEAKKITGARYGTILLVKDNKLTRVYTTLPRTIGGTSRPNGFSYDAFSKGEPLVVDAKKVLPHHPELKKIRLKASIMVPLSYYHHTIGVLTLAMTKNKKISKRLLQMLKLFGAMTSLSIRKTQLYSQATQALETRDLFISMASHELRTPLTAIHVYTHLLKKKLSTGSELQWIEGLSQEVNLLTRLVNELLNVELIKTGNFSFNKQIVDIRDIIERCLKQFHTTFPYQKVMFLEETHGANAIIQGDFDKMTQMLQNILENAAKFSAKEADIVLTLSIEKSHVVIRISDQGRGMSKRDARRVSTMFYKEKGNYKEGMGLGLYISKIIVDEHSGSIAIRSMKKKGTTVTITIPMLQI